MSEAQNGQSNTVQNEDIKNYLPFKAKGDIDDFIFEGNCTQRHSER